MKTILTCCLMMSFVACHTTGTDQAGLAWLRRSPSAINDDEWTELPRSDIYEVAASKEDVVVLFDLAEQTIEPLTQDRASYLTGHYFQCPRSKKPFLVRAVYGQGGTGGYRIFKHGDDLLIAHGSLGHHSAYHKSALVLNLDFTPAQIYIEAAIAE
jgi:hypothetical protein